MPDASDDTVELLHRWHAGERSALEQLLEQHVPLLLEFVRQHMHAELRALRREQDAMDLVQSAAAKVMSYVPSFVPEGGAQFQRLLRTFVRNEIRNSLRAPRISRRMGAREDCSDSVLDLRSSSHSSMIPDRAAQKSERKEVARAMARMALEFLDEEDRRVVELRQFEDLSWEEAATELGMRPDGVRMRYNRALPKLANHIRRLKEGRIEELLESTGC